MTLQLWTLIVDIVSAVGVIITLIYLAVQVRQNTNQARADNSKAIRNHWIEAQNALFRSEEGAEFLRRALNDFQGLSPAQKGRFNAFMLDLISSFVEVHESAGRNLVEREAYVGIERVVSAYMRCPGASDYWQASKSVYPPDIVKQVDLAIESHDDPPMNRLPHLIPDQ